jgi:hypothetical protein
MQSGAFSYGNNLSANKTQKLDQKLKQIKPKTDPQEHL